MLNIPLTQPVLFFLAGLKRIPYKPYSPQELTSIIESRLANVNVFEDVLIHSFFRLLLRFLTGSISLASLASPPAAIE
jgi:hypothetical protein